MRRACIGSNQGTEAWRDHRQSSERLGPVDDSEEIVECSICVEARPTCRCIELPTVLQLVLVLVGDGEQRTEIADVFVCHATPPRECLEYHGRLDIGYQHREGRSSPLYSRACTATSSAGAANAKLNPGIASKPRSPNTTVVRDFPVIEGTNRSISRGFRSSPDGAS